MNKFRPDFYFSIWKKNMLSQNCFCFCFQIVEMPPKTNSEKRPKVFFSQKVQELILLKVKDNYEPLYHDMTMKNSPDKKKTAWQNLLDYANEVLEKEKPGCNKVQDIRKFHEILTVASGTFLQYS